MNPTQLRYFSAICSCDNNMTAASKLLKVSQPTISSAIYELEKELDVQLFYRSSNKLLLTEEGSKCLVMVEDILSSIDQLSQRMQKLASGKKQLKMAIPTMTSAIIVPTMIKDFKKQYPDIEMDIYVYQTNEIKKLMRTGKFDLAIINSGFYETEDDFIGEESPDSYNHIFMMDMELCFCTNIHNKFAKKQIISYEEIKDEPLSFIKYGNTPVLGPIENFHSRGLHPNILLFSDQIGTIREMIASGDCSAIMFSRLLEKTDPIVAIPMEGNNHFRIEMVYRKSQSLPEELLEFVDFVENYNFSKEDLL